MKRILAVSSIGDSDFSGNGCFVRNCFRSAWIRGMVQFLGIRSFIEQTFCESRERHHQKMMGEAKSVKDHPEMAANPDSIKFLSPKEHLEEHGGNWRNLTNGELKSRDSE